MNKHIVILIVCFFIKTPTFAQDDDALKTILIKDSTALITNPIDPLRPARAAFYSAIVPGLGQAYNKQYWKIPLVYVGMGVGMYFFNTNNNNYREYRNVYKRRLAGYTDDDYSFLDNNALVRAQRFYQKSRDLSLLVVLGFYILNIVDANISGHLMPFNVNTNLSISPEVYQDPLRYTYTMGVSMSYRF